MPTFDFRCGTCGTVFEYTRPFGSKATPVCPHCKSKRIEKLLSPPAIHFKGSGFYKTDSSPKAPTSKTSEPAKAKEKDAAKKTKKDGPPSPISPPQSPVSNPPSPASSPQPPTNPV